MREPPLRRRELLIWTKDLLRKYGIRPRDRLSQNFVVDPRLITDVLERIEKNLTTAEIGAGLGTLSYYISRTMHAGSLFFEVDPRLAVIAYELIEKPHILVVSDALNHEWRTRQIVSNAPYHITSEILVKLVKSNSIRRAVLVLQKDVVDRLRSRPGSRNYGRITIIVNIVYRLELGPIYPPSSFYPAPRVSSQLIVLERIRSFDEELGVLEEVTRRLFSKRRKRVEKVLREEFGIDPFILDRIGLDPDKRIYELDAGELLRLTRFVREQGLI
jgi:16S rRNA (adenine1518-N6/adenine1519-N6)-dimethyltransferase